ncbi:hypothetical protein BJ165DRAFT_1525675 [Panaeolus papilionaceus]|nr:hypothetical protein BJ165DRAFT_1525675 [Panaeolus papilionaceus]
MPHLSFLLSFLLLVPALQSAVAQGFTRCSTQTPSGDVRAQLDANFTAMGIEPIDDEELVLSSRGLGSRRRTIDVFFNVLYKNQTREGGYLPRNMITDQMWVLNEDYRKTGLSFNLKKLTYYKNETWYGDAFWGNDPNREMSLKLRKGGPDTLNIYSVGFTAPFNAGYLGYATFPYEYIEYPEIDGVVLLGESLPGGTATNYNLGKTLTHEVGPWVGLWHTFQTEYNDYWCEETPGDEVGDTPAQEGPSSGCPIGRDSCPGHEGLDPIHNYMDYSYDSCLTEFSRGQIRRLRGQLFAYRGINLGMRRRKGGPKGPGRH